MAIIGNARWRHLARGIDKKLCLHPVSDTVIPDEGGAPETIVRMELAIEPVYEQNTVDGGIALVVKWPDEVTFSPKEPVRTELFTYNFSGDIATQTVTTRIAMITTSARIPDNSVADSGFWNVAYSETVETSPLVGQSGYVYAPGGTFPARKETRCSVFVDWDQRRFLQDESDLVAVYPLPTVEAQQSDAGYEFVPVDDADDFPAADYYPRVKKNQENGGEG